MTDEELNAEYSRLWKVSLEAAPEISRIAGQRLIHTYCYNLKNKIIESVQDGTPILTAINDAFGVIETTSTKEYFIKVMKKLLECQK